MWILLAYILGSRVEAAASTGATGEQVSQHVKTLSEDRTMCPSDIIWYIGIGKRRGDYFLCAASSLVVNFG